MRTVSPAPSRPFSRRHISGRCLRGSQRWPSARKENTRSLAREASSSRRAPPKAASKRCLSSAWRRRLGLHHLGVDRGRVVDRVDAARHAVLVGVHDEVEAQLARGAIAEGDHVAELPGGIDVQQRERRLGRIERLARQMQQHRGVLADRIEQHRRAELRRRLAEDVDALRLQQVEVAERRRVMPRPPCAGGAGWRAARTPCRPRSPTTSAPRARPRRGGWRACRAGSRWRGSLCACSGFTGTSLAAM